MKKSTASDHFYSSNHFSENMFVMALELYEPVLSVVTEFDPRVYQLALDLQQSV
jgi:hypothetical protein